MTDFKNELQLASNEKELLRLILGYFKDLKVTEYDLKAPNANFVIEFYKCFLNEFFVDVNAIMQIQMSQMTVLGEYCDMFMEVLPLMNLSEAVRKFQIPALKTFCYFDLINPRPKRTFIHISNVMQFIAFADSRVESMMPKLEKVKDMEIKKETLLRNIDKVKEDYNARLMDIADRKSREKDKNAEKEKLKVEVEEMYPVRDQLVERSNTVKSKLNKLGTKYDDILKEYQMLENDIEELNRQIQLLKVNETTLDPSTVQLSIDILEGKAKDTSESLKNARENLTSRQKSCEIEKKIYSAMINRVETLKKVINFVKDKVGFDKVCEDITKEIKTERENLNKRKSSLQTMEEELNKKREEFVALRLQWTKQKSSLEESLAVAKREFQSKSKINSEKWDEVNKINQEVAYYNEKIIENEERYDEFLDAVEQNLEDDKKEEEEAIEKGLEYLKNLK